MLSVSLLTQLVQGASPMYVLAVDYSMNKAGAIKTTLFNVTLSLVILYLLYHQRLINSAVISLPSVLE